MKKQTGFTLIELVVVMVILGILAAVALPKFVDMSSQARQAKMQGVYGAVQSSVAVIHAQYLASGSPTTGTIAYEGGTLAVGTNTQLVNGYPAADTFDKANQNLANLDSNVSTTGSGTAPARTMTISDTTKTTNCKVVFVDSTAVGTPPSVTLTTSGC